MRFPAVLKCLLTTSWLAPRLAGIIGLSIVGGLLWAPVWAERYAPEIQLESPSETLDAPSDTYTPVTDLVPYGDTRLLRPAGSAAALPVSPSGQVPVLQGEVKMDKAFQPDVVFDDNYTLPKGEKLVLTILDMVASGYNQPGDPFSARVKYAVERDGHVLIPAGALVKGHIDDVADPGKLLSKRARMALAFDYLLMPDGRKIPFKSAYTKGDSAMGAVGRAVGNGIGGTIGGAIRGVLLGLRFGGLGAAAATNGATLIGGGGLGAVAGLGDGISRSGSHVLLNEGDEIKVALEEPLSLPSIVQAPDTDNEVHAPGLTVRITDYDLGRDTFKVENQIRLALEIDNNTSYRFGSFDMVLMDEYDTVYALSPFGEREDMLVFQIEPNSRFKGQAAFSVKAPEVRHYLVLYKPYTREILAKISLTEALKQLSVSPKKPARAKAMRKATADLD